MITSHVMRFAVAVAVVLAAGGCAQLKSCAYSGTGRDGWQKPEQVIYALALKPGDTVADLGAGGGYFTFRLANAVGDEGTVYAIDVDPDMTGYLTDKIADEGAANVQVILAEYDDPLIPEEGVDLILTVNTYHHIEDRSAYFSHTGASLRPGGRIAVIEFSGKGSWFTHFFGHYTDPNLIRTEMESAGYHLEQNLDLLDRQSFQIFARK